MNEKIMRVTKTQRFEDVITLLQGGETSRTSMDEAIEFLKNEIDLTTRKNAKRSTKLTATQQENEGFKTLILDFLAGQASPVTCTEIGKGIPELNGFNNQKISSLVRALTFNEEKNPEGQVKRELVKGKSVFSLR